MHWKPRPSGPGGLDGDDSWIAWVISLSVRSCQGILSFPAGVAASSWTAGGGGKKVAQTSFTFSANAVAGSGPPSPGKVGVRSNFLGLVYLWAVKSCFPCSSTRKECQCSSFVAWIVWKSLFLLDL